MFHNAFCNIIVGFDWGVLRKPIATNVIKISRNSLTRNFFKIRLALNFKIMTEWETLSNCSELLTHLEKTVTQSLFGEKSIFEISFLASYIFIFVNIILAEMGFHSWSIPAAAAACALLSGTAAQQLISEQFGPGSLLILLVVFSVLKQIVGIYVKMDLRKYSMHLLCK